MKRVLSSVSDAFFRFSVPATAIAAVLLLSAPVHANPKLLITELSDTDLTVTLDGVAIGTVTNIVPDKWEWRSNIFGNGLAFNSPANGWNIDVIGAFWTEPSDATKANFVGLQSFASSQNGIPPSSFNLGLVIDSDVVDFRDVSPFGPNSAVPDGALGYSDFRGGYSFFGPSEIVFGPYDVYFSDLGDTAKTPDSSSTLALLGLAGAAATIVARRRSARKIASIGTLLES